METQTKDKIKICKNCGCLAYAHGKECHTEIEDTKKAGYIKTCCCRKLEVIEI